MESDSIHIVRTTTRYIVHKDRLRSPLKRTGKREVNKFEEISWDETSAPGKEMIDDRSLC